MIEAAAVQSHDAVGRFDVAVDVNRLVEIQHAIVAPAERVQNVVRIFGAESRKNNAARVCFATVMLVG